MTKSSDMDKEFQMYLTIRIKTSNWHMKSSSTTDYYHSHLNHNCYMMPTAILQWPMPISLTSNMEKASLYQDLYGSRKWKLTSSKFHKNKLSFLKMSGETQNSESFRQFLYLFNLKFSSLVCKWDKVLKKLYGFLCQFFLTKHAYDIYIIWWSCNLICMKLEVIESI